MQKIIFLLKKIQKYRMCPALPGLYAGQGEALTRNGVDHGQVLDAVHGRLAGEGDDDVPDGVVAEVVVAVVFVRDVD